MKHTKTDNVGKWPVHMLVFIQRLWIRSTCYWSNGKMDVAHETEKKFICPLMFHYIQNHVRLKDIHYWWWYLFALLNPCMQMLLYFFHRNFQKHRSSDVLLSIYASLNPLNLFISHNIYTLGFSSLLRILPKIKYPRIIKYALKLLGIK